MNLGTYVQEFLIEHLKKFAKNPKFYLKDPLLELLLKRDDLIVDEIEIWESLLKWCFVQQNVKNEPENWGKDGITEIEI